MWAVQIFWHHKRTCQWGIQWHFLTEICHQIAKVILSVILSLILKNNLLQVPQLARVTFSALERSVVFGMNKHCRKKFSFLLSLPTLLRSTELVQFHKVILFVTLSDKNDNKRQSARKEQQCFEKPQVRLKKLNNSVFLV